jgi:hypothetical protein
VKKEKPEARSQEPEGERKSCRRGRIFAFSTGFWLLASGFLLCGTSCSSKPSSSDQQSEKALRDPMGYSPKIEKTDVSGGGWLDYDKEGMRKDLKNVLDP